MQFTILLEDLETAKKLTEQYDKTGKGDPVFETCVVTIAARRQLKNEKLVSAYGAIYELDTAHGISGKNQVLLDIMKNFDDEQYDKINLPITVELTKEEGCEYYY